MPAAWTIRDAVVADLAALPSIERAAAAQFRDAGLEGAWIDATTSAADFGRAFADGRLWVACVERDGESVPIGFAVAEKLADGTPHLREVDVLPSFGRRGVGRALVDHVAAWARASGAAALTLTTFRDVPWNAPFYRRLGFRELAPEDLSPALRALSADEARAGLPMDERVAMTLALR